MRAIGPRPHLLRPPARKTEAATGAAAGRLRRPWAPRWPLLAAAPWLGCSLFFCAAAQAAPHDEQAAQQLRLGLAEAARSAPARAGAAALPATDAAADAAPAAQAPWAAAFAFDLTPLPQPAPTAPLQLDELLAADAEAPQVAQATRRLEAGDLPATAAALAGTQGAAAQLVAARLALRQGDAAAALAATGRAAADGNLRPWVLLAEGQAQLLAGNAELALEALWPLVRSQLPVGAQAVVPLAQALQAQDPEQLLDVLLALGRRLDPGDVEGKSLLLAARADAEERLGSHRAASLTRLARYLEAPLAPSTPKTWPEDLPPTPEQALARIELLVDAHRNDAAAADLVALEAQLGQLAQALERARPGAEAAQLGALLTPAQTVAFRCRQRFAEGIVARKKHRYAQAEQALGWVAAHCPDAERVRRAAFVRAKVVSIQDGLRALPLIEAFVAAYPNHTMTDDVLFWAGDSLQRRGRDAEAARYYARINALPRLDDQCAEASWRLAWMARKSKRRAEAKKLLQDSLSGRCPLPPPARARARYWLGRLEEESARPQAACRHYQALLTALPLSFYAQQALPRLLALLPPRERRALRAKLAPPPAATAHKPRPLCASGLVAQPAFARARYLLGRGLGPDALLELKTLKLAVPAGKKAPLQSCSAGQASLLLCQLLARAGGYKEAQNRLLRDFGAELAAAPLADNLPIWQAAYPLAYRPAIAAAEQESALPTFLLQALSREESRFDAEVVSWAQAVGLTQLLLPSAQLAGRTLRPPVVVPDIHALEDAERNARLGAALLAGYQRRLGGFWPLALAAYNGGQETALSWWRRHAGCPFEVFAEEMTIYETRTYVQRVLQTFGIYRWLYAGAEPALAAPKNLPKLPGN